MNNSEEWATTVRVTEALQKASCAQPVNIAMPNDHGPSSAVQLATENVLLSGGPTEYFSDKMPVVSQPIKEALRPIDE